MRIRSSKNYRRLFAMASAMALMIATQASAHSIIAQTAAGNFVFAAGTPVIPGTVTPFFANPAGARFLVTFTAECAVNAPAGNTTAWTDVDILVLNAAGVVVQTLPPTVGINDAFCSSDGSLGLSGWQSNAVTAVGGPGLVAGNYRVAVRARLNNGATQASYGERSIVVSR